MEKKYRQIIVPSLLLLILIFNQSAFSQKAGENAFLAPIEKQILAELNFARQHPQKYAQFLIQRKSLYVGKLFKHPDNYTIQTKEGVRAVEEAIRFLKSAKPLAPFLASKGMSLAAEDHVKSQGTTKRTGHKGTDGSSFEERLNRYGTWAMTIGENIAYGRESARDNVIGLIVDDGVRGRGHRKNIFNPEFKIVGIAFGEHRKYGSMCVIDFAGGYIENR